MASLTHMERAVPCSAQRQGAAPSRQMYAAAPRTAFAKSPAFTAATKAHAAQQTRSVVVKAASSMVGEAELPAGFKWYETMVVLRPDMSDEQRDQELAKFEAFLKKQAAHDIKVTVRGRQRLAYPIKRFAEGIYVLYTYSAGSTVAGSVQKMLSTPEAGAELNILRHMTFVV